MINKVLLFNTEHEAAEGLKKLQSSGIDKGNLSVLVSNVEHSRLLNSETDIHIDLFSEITSANRRNEGGSGADEAGLVNDEGAVDGLVFPFYAQQTSMQVPTLGVIGMTHVFDQHEQGVPSLMSYGLSEENAHRCLQALRAGQCIVCISGQAAASHSDERQAAGVFDNLALGFAGGESGATGGVGSGALQEIGAAEVLNNHL